MGELKLASPPSTAGDTAFVLVPSSGLFSSKDTSTNSVTLPSGVGYSDMIVSVS